MGRLQENSEILTVVDEHDRVIGARRRDEIHRLGLRHRATHVLVFDLAGRLFLQRRGLHKDSNPGLWDSSVAGHVDDGESYDQCCIREIKEEIGIPGGVRTRAVVQSRCLCRHWDGVLLDISPGHGQKSRTGLQRNGSRRMV